MISAMRQIEEAMAKVDPEQVRKSLEGSKFKAEEQVVGKVSDELLRLFGLIYEQSDDMQRHAIRGAGDLRGLPASKEETQVFLAKSEKLDEHFAFLRKLFWDSVRMDFPEIGQKAIGIRAEGQIVCFEEEQEPSVVVAVVELETGGPLGLLNRLMLSGLAKRRAKGQDPSRN